MKKFFLIIITVFMISIQNTFAQGYFSVNHGIELLPSNDFKISNQTINFQGGVSFGKNSIEMDFQYGFEEEFLVSVGKHFESNNITNFRLGMNYVYTNKIFYSKIGAGMKNYHISVYDNSKDINGCDLKLGVGLLIPIVVDKFMFNIGFEATNMFNKDYHDIENTLLTPKIGFKLNV